MINGINSFLGVANSVFLTESFSGEKCKKDLCSNNLDKADKAGDWYGYLNQQIKDNPTNWESLNLLLKIKK